jgi:hypothetical protein
MGAQQGCYQPTNRRADTYYAYKTLLIQALSFTMILCLVISAWDYGIHISPSSFTLLKTPLLP